MHIYENIANILDVQLQKFYLMRFKRFMPKSGIF